MGPKGKQEATIAKKEEHRQCSNKRAHNVSVGGGAPVHDSMDKGDRCS